MKIFRIVVNLFRFDRANWTAVALCVFAAAVFWLFNAFNKKYATNVRFPLVFEYNHERYIPAEPLPHQININVSGNGWDLFRKHLGLKLPELTISLDRPLETRRIAGSSLVPVLASQLGKLVINYVVTDTLRIAIDNKDSHKYKVRADLSDVSFRSGFGRISPVVVLPDSVELIGPKNVLHSIDTIKVNVSKDNLSEDYREEAEVYLPKAGMVKINPPVVQVMFEVGAITVVKKKVKVKVIKGKKNVANLLTDSINMEFQIPVKSTRDFSILAREMEAEIDIRKEPKGDHSFLPKAPKLPAYALLLRTDSVKVRLN